VEEMKLGNRARGLPNFQATCKSPEQSFRALSVVQGRKQWFCRKSKLIVGPEKSCVVLAGVMRAARMLCTLAARLAYLGCMVTVNELLEVLVSVPPKVAEPVVEMSPVCSGTKFTVTTMVWPPGRLAKLHVRVPPTALVAIPPHVPWLALAETNWKLGGSGSVKATFGAGVLPVLFLICQVKVSPVPWFGPPLRAEPLTSISALTPPVVVVVPPPPPPPTGTGAVGTVTLVVELAILFAAEVSINKLPAASRSCTAAVLVMAVAPERTVTLTVACAPAFSAPRLQVKTAPVCVQTPCELDEDWKAAGKVSVSVTSAALPGPLLVTVMAKVTNAPALTVAGEVMVIARSVPCGDIGVTALDGSDSALLPTAFVACTVNE
jgi:hypothetical protein